MSISKYEAFIKSIELGSLTGAAADLGYTQSGITHLLNSLEEECGMKLIVRKKSGACATAEGEQMLPYFREVIRAYEGMKEKSEQLRSLESGLVRVLTFSSVAAHWLPDIIARFHEAHPGIEIRLFFGSHEDLVNWFDEGKIDLGFVAAQQLSDVNTYELASDPMVVIAPKEHELARKGVVSADDLMRYPFIKLMDGNVNAAEEVEQLLHSQGITPHVAYEQMDDAAMIAMVERGLGISVMPALSVMDSRDRVAVLPMDFPAERRIGIEVRDKKKLTPAVELFVRFVVSWARRREEEKDA